MSFFLDPPALILLGALVYYSSKKVRLRRLYVILIGVIIVTLFIVVSGLLYLDKMRWYIPFIFDMRGSEWMFHSNITDIYKDEVSVYLVLVMFGLYPLWYYSGYVAAQYLLRKTQIEKKVYNSSHVKSLKRPRTDAFSVKRGTEPRRLLRECLLELGGIEAFVKEGDRVLVKTNICGGNPTRPGSFASIAVADEFSRLIWEHDANPVIVDADMIWTEFWQVASEEGYITWSKHAPAKLINLSETKLAYFDFGGVLEKTLISKEMLEADVIVSLATMKTHILTGVTLGMKNMYGTLPQMDKAIYHKLGIEQVIFEVNKAFPPNLTIIDGTIGGEAMGPLSSEPVDFQTIVASGNVVTADAVACTLMGFNPLDIGHIKRAHEAGVGNAEVKIEMPKPPHEKDGNWVKPGLDTAKFYNKVVEEFLKYPGGEIFFNLLADFALYDVATLPIFRDLTPELQFILNDIFDAAKRSGKIKRKRG